jgi:hypothetical protein
VNAAAKFDVKETNSSSWDQAEFLPESAWKPASVRKKANTKKGSRTSQVRPPINFGGKKKVYNKNLIRRN